MPFTMLDETKERQIVETVFETLYTPYGLRTLEIADEEFRSFIHIMAVLSLSVIWHIIRELCGHFRSVRIIWHI